jgi:hypothetical protein
MHRIVLHRITPGYTGKTENRIAIYWPSCVAACTGSGVASAALGFLLATELQILQMFTFALSISRSYMTLTPVLLQIGHVPLPFLGFSFNPFPL